MILCRVLYTGSFNLYVISNTSHENYNLAWIKLSHLEQRRRKQIQSVCVGGEGGWVEGAPVALVATCCEQLQTTGI